MVQSNFIYTSIGYTGIQLVRSPPATHAYTTNYGLTKSTVKNMMSDRVMPARSPRNKTIKQPSALPIARQTSPTGSTQNKYKNKTTHVCPLRCLRLSDYPCDLGPR